MSSLARFVGLDYSDKAIQVCVLAADGRQIANRLCGNDWRAIVDFVEKHGKVVEAAIESCTGAANLAEELVARAGWSVHLAHPGYVARRWPIAGFAGCITRCNPRRPEGGRKRDEEDRS